MADFASVFFTGEAGRVSRGRQKISDFRDDEMVCVSNQLILRRFTHPLETEHRCLAAVPVVGATW